MYLFSQETFQRELETLNREKLLYIVYVLYINLYTYITEPHTMYMYMHVHVCIFYICTIYMYRCI